MGSNNNNGALLEIPPNFRRKDDGPYVPKAAPTLLVMPTGPSPYDARREREAKREARLIRAGTAEFNRNVLRAERDRVFAAVEAGATTHGEVEFRLSSRMTARRISAALQALVRTGRIVKLSRKRYKMKE